jgi:hypothetical protein
MGAIVELECRLIGKSGALGNFTLVFTWWLPPTCLRVGNGLGGRKVRGI